VTSQKGGTASKTESSLVSTEVSAAKRFGEVKVLVFFLREEENLEKNWIILFLMA
jgi:hypothetical protein